MVSVNSNNKKMRTKHSINARKVEVTEGKHKGHRMIEWTCPDCGERNLQFWFGRQKHYCNNCDKPTDLKGFNQ